VGTGQLEKGFKNQKLGCGKLSEAAWFCLLKAVKKRKKGRSPALEKKCSIRIDDKMRLINGERTQRGGRHRKLDKLLKGTPGF